MSLQERLEVLPAALVPWRQARSFLSAQAKAEARAEHLDQLAHSDNIPGWALGLEPLPGYLDRDIAEIIRYKRMHAIETLKHTRDLLQTKAREHGVTGRAQLITCQIIYKDQDAAWNQAKDLLSQLVGNDRAKCITALKKRTEYLMEHPLSEDAISKQLLEGSRNGSRRQPPRNRSRSRSPGQNQENRRPNNRSNTASSSTTSRDNTTSSSNADSRPPSGRGRGRGGQRPRSNSRSRNVLQFSRNNFNGRARSPQTTGDTRSTNSLWNEDNRGRPAPQRQRNSGRNLNLTPDEAALVRAFRDQQ